MAKEMDVILGISSTVSACFLMAINVSQGFRARVLAWNKTRKWRVTRKHYSYTCHVKTLDPVLHFLGGISQFLLIVSSTLECEESDSGKANKKMNKAPVLEDVFSIKILQHWRWGIWQVAIALRARASRLR